MSEPLMITLVAVTVNLAGMLLIYSFIAFFLTRLHWRDRGIPAVVVTIIVAQVFWILPSLIGLDYSFRRTGTPFLFLVGDSLVSVFSIILFCQTVKGIPRELEDSARLDGCGWFGTYWHVVLPLVRWDLGWIALLIIMATTLPVLIALAQVWVSSPSPLTIYLVLARVLALSAIATVPLIAVFMIAKRRLRHTTYGRGG